MRFPQFLRRFLRFLKRLPRFLRGEKKEEIAKEPEVKKGWIRRLLQFQRRKKKEVEVEKPEMRKVKREFPRISKAEQKKHIGMHVGIVGGKIVASASSAEKALGAAKRKYPSEEIALRYVGSERLLIKCKCLE